MEDDDDGDDDDDDDDDSDDDDDDDDDDNDVDVDDDGGMSIRRLEKRRFFGERFQFNILVDHDLADFSSLFFP